jgi:hypothetical protein
MTMIMVASKMSDFREAEYQTRARNNVPNVPDHSDRQSRLFADQIKMWPIRSILPSFAKYAIKYTSEQEV